MSPSKRIPQSILMLKLARFYTVKWRTEEGEVEARRFDVRKELSLTGQSPERILDQHAQQVFFWNHLQAEVRKSVTRAQRDYDRFYHQVYLAYRLKFEKDRENATEPWLKAVTLTHEKVEDKQEILDELRANLEVIATICTALEHRRYNLPRRTHEPRS